MMYSVVFHSNFHGISATNYFLKSTTCHTNLFAAPLKQQQQQQQHNLQTCTNLNINFLAPEVI